MATWQQRSKAWLTGIIHRPKKAPSLELLKILHSELLKARDFGADNNKQLVETYRSVAEVVIWGDQNDSKVFDYFLEHGMLSFFLKTLSQSSDGRVIVQLLQSLSIIFENITNEMAMYYLLSNNHVNCIIGHKYDVANEEVLAYYISLLKTLSLRLNKHTIHLFYNEHLRDFPLLTESLQYFLHSEGMVRIAVRNITLNIFRVADPRVDQFVCQKVGRPFLARLTWYIGSLTIDAVQLIEGGKPGVTGQLSSLIDAHLDHWTYLNDVLQLDQPGLAALIEEFCHSRLLRPLYLASFFQAFDQPGETPEQGGETPSFDHIGEGTKPDLSTKPADSGKPEDYTNPDLSTNPNIDTYPDLSTNPNIDTNSDLSTNPDYSTKPEDGSELVCQADNTVADNTVVGTRGQDNGLADLAGARLGVRGKRGPESNQSNTAHSSATGSRQAKQEEETGGEHKQEMAAQEATTEQVLCNDGLLKGLEQKLPNIRREYSLFFIAQILSVVDNPRLVEALTTAILQHQPTSQQQGFTILMDFLVCHGNELFCQLCILFLIVLVTNKVSYSIAKEVLTDEQLGLMESNTVQCLAAVCQEGSTLGCRTGLLCLELLGRIGADPSCVQYCESLLRARMRHWLQVMAGDEYVCLYKAQHRKAKKVRPLSSALCHDAASLLGQHRAREQSSNDCDKVMLLFFAVHSFLLSEGILPPTGLLLGDGDIIELGGFDMFMACLISGGRETELFVAVGPSQWCLVEPDRLPGQGKVKKVISLDELDYTPDPASSTTVFISQRGHRLSFRLRFSDPLVFRAAVKCMGRNRTQCIRQQLASIAMVLDTTPPDLDSDDCGLGAGLLESFEIIQPPEGGGVFAQTTSPQEMEMAVFSDHGNQRTTSVRFNKDDCSVDIGSSGVGSEEEEEEGSTTSNEL